MKDKLQFFGVESREYCPFIREKSEDLLVKLLKEVKPKKILEIGTFLGYSASIMAEVCPEAEIVTLEKSEINFSDAQKNLQGYSNIKSLCCDALDYLQNNQNVLFDFVFLIFICVITPNILILSPSDKPLESSKNIDVV